MGYPAAITNWREYSIPLSERADSILALLLAERDLSSGNIVFIGHSLGGLVVKQILRNAERDSGSNRKANEFLSRVRRVVFLGTPQKGSFLATIAGAVRIPIRTSAATRDLVLGNPQLVDLNHWYRKYSEDNGIENKVLAEVQPKKIFGIVLPEYIGTIVSARNTDIGLSVIPIPVDVDHMGLTRPANRDAEVYTHVRDFIVRPFSSQPQGKRSTEEIEKHTKEIQVLTEITQEYSTTISDLKRRIGDAAVHRIDSTIIDAEVKQRLERLRKGRLFSTFNTTNETRVLVAALQKGDLALASDGEKAMALAWCARFLSLRAPAEAESILNGIAFPNPEASGIARACIAAFRGNLQEALGELCAIGTSVAYGAAFISVVVVKGFQEADQWLREAGLTLADLDSDAKYCHLAKALNEGRWHLAFQAAKELGDTDFERSPGLIFMTATAFLLQAVPDELRMTVVQYVPVSATEFPLRSEPAALEHRRAAVKLYERMHSIAESLEMPEVAIQADDMALWLRLSDPEESDKARQDLNDGMKDPSTFLRRIGLALQFQADIDLERAEREVDHQTTLSGSMSYDAAAARLALAFTKESHTETAAYIGKHRDQLLQHLNWKGIYFFEIEVLTKSGQTAQAKARIEEAANKGLTEAEVVRLRHMLTEATGGDVIAERLAAFEEGESIVDLRMLVNAYEDADDWPRVSEYGRTLLDCTGDIADARKYVIALYNLERLDDAMAVFEAYPALLDRYDGLRLLYTQTLFERGRINDARTALQALRETKDSPNARQLEINLAIVSGDWESMQGFVEDEWNARGDRTPTEMLRAGQIAQRLGVARGKELVRQAACRSPNDPAILAGCYNTASVAGWEDHAEVHQWIERAAELSGDDGPVRRVTIEDLLKAKPDWSRRESKAWDLLAKGEIPIYAGGHFLNRSLLDLYLLSALRNLDEPDVRKRPIVYAFSGVREKCEVEPKIVAMDVTALITAEFLNLFDVYIETFDYIIVPHNTLAWLFEEKAKILFHQPSRVVAARELRQMVSEGHIQTFEGSSIVPDPLVDEVGETLAMLIAEASSDEHADLRQRRVVRGRPVYKANTFMREPADLGPYKPYFCSTFDVVDKLAQKGLLTVQEAEDARAALNLREDRWESESPIDDGAVLYLDNLTVSHLQFLGLLSKLRRANVTAVLSPSELEEADALISYDARGADVVSIVDQLRLRLRQCLEDGTVRLGAAIRVDDEDSSEEITSHPTIAMLKLIDEADAVVVDDRFINQHASMESATTSRPLITTLDLLNVLKDQGTMSVAEIQAAITKLRLASFGLIPVTAVELTELITAAPVVDGVLTETAELRAVRESVQRVRMGDVLQLPREIGWLNSVTESCLLTLRQLWTDDLDEAAVGAQSDWLLELGDVRGWTHRLNETSQELMARHCNWVTMLSMVPVSEPRPVKEAFWRWFESKVLKPIKEEDPDSYRSLVERAKEIVAVSVEACTENLERTQ